MVTMGPQHMQGCNLLGCILFSTDSAVQQIMPRVRSRTRPAAVLGAAAAVVAFGIFCDAQALLSGPLLQPVGNLLSDPVESCRATALQLLLDAAPQLAGALLSWAGTLALRQSCSTSSHTPPNGALTSLLQTAAVQKHRRIY